MLMGSGRVFLFNHQNDFTITHLLLVFVKHPEAGEVKTRLAKGIGQEKALIAYQRLLAYTRDLIFPLTCEKAIFYGNTMPADDLWAQAGYQRYAQAGPDLGSRMEHAFQWGFSQGHERILVIGSDCATLTSRIVQEGFDQLAQHDAVLGPARDGGYYLLGINAPPLPTLFRNKAWSTSSVLQDTLADLKSARKSVFLLPELSDIDTVDDLPGTFLEDLMA